ncbi:MAG: hypothetical protein A2Z51_02745 [Deltaproteobacteria bacterium RBG_19FT_COMBO_52_11]|jgi:hypothetical protein|nr:MAG: hypothetical protein A2Z51_02745 [Deltaproteobacteria bacterium RBG_19FT_COMBO_52_11]
MVSFTAPKKGNKGKSTIALIVISANGVLIHGARFVAPGNGTPRKEKSILAENHAFTIFSPFPRVEHYLHNFRPPSSELDRNFFLLYDSWTHPEGLL